MSGEETWAMKKAQEKKLKCECYANVTIHEMSHYRLDYRLCEMDVHR